VCRGMPSCPWDTCGGGRDAGLWDFCGARRRPLAARRAVSCVGHDAVVGAAGPGAAGAGAVRAEHAHRGTGRRTALPRCSALA